MKAYAVKQTDHTVTHQTKWNQNDLLVCQNWINCMW